MAPRGPWAEREVIITRTDTAMPHGARGQECGWVLGWAWSFEPESLHCFSPGCVCSTFLSLQTVLYHMAEWGCPNSKSCMLWVCKPMSRNRFSGPIPNYLETWNLIHLGSSDRPWSNQLGNRGGGGQRGVDTQHNHSSTPVLIEVTGQGENWNTLPWDMDKVDRLRGRRVNRRVNERQ